MASEKESERLKAAIDRLRKIAEEIEALEDTLGLSPEAIKRLPKEYRAKSAWGEYANIDRDISRAATAVRQIMSAAKWGLSLAEASEINDA